jgi:hypothetical protein
VRKAVAMIVFCFAAFCFVMASVNIAIEPRDEAVKFARFVIASLVVPVLALMAAVWLWRNPRNPFA